MTLNLQEASTVFTLLCYLIKDGGPMTESERELYQRYLSEGWVDTVNKEANNEAV